MFKVNNPPVVVNPIADVTEQVGFSTYDIDISLVFNDIDADILSYTVLSVNQSVVTAFISGVTLTITEIGSGMSDIIVIANDGNGGIAEDVFMFKVNNPPVVVNPIADVTEQAGFSTYDIDISDVFSDTDSDILSYTVLSSNQSVVIALISGVTLTITEIGSGTSEITVIANDGNGGIAEDMFMFSINYIATVDLLEGWTWFSLNLDADDMSLENIFSSITLSNDDYIKNQTSSATYYDGFGWFGALEVIDPSQMYQINLAGSDVLEFTGMAVDPTSNPINLTAGWTWIGYLPQVGLDINIALASLSLDSDDYIKNQTGSATYYDNFGWFGALETLSPYDGYKISMSNTDVLTYPTTTMKSATQSELPIFANNTGITVNPYKYEFSGTVTARVFNNNELSNSEDDLLLAYVGDECRGISKAMYFEPTDGFAYQLMIYSNIVEGENITFKYFDSQNNELYECVESIKFTNDMVMSDAFNALDLNTKSALGIVNTIDYEAFNVYPNPTSGITTIDYTLKNTSEVLIVVFDIYGKQIKEIENKIVDAGNYATQWNAEINESGTYFIKIVSNNSIQMRKVVLMK
jgi:hypothetical protein